MNRRDTICVLAAIGVGPYALAQSTSKLPRIAFVDTAVVAADLTIGRHPYWGALQEELRKLGHVDGKTVTIDRWSGGGDTAGYAALANKVAASGPQVIIERGRTLLVMLAAATSSIPIVAIGTIPVELSGSLSRPRKNVTGIQASADEMQIYSKGLEFLGQMTKQNSRIAWFGTHAVWESIVGEAARKGAARGKLDLQPILVGDLVDETAMRSAFARLDQGKFDSVLVSPATELFPHRQLLAELMVARRLPTGSSSAAFTEAGLTMSYGPDYPSLYRRAAQFVDRLLKGAKPADLPIEQPSTFIFAINLKTAKKIGVTIPQSLLLRADQVIE